LRFEEALVLLRERWQMELLYKLWKQHVQMDEWRTADPWRKLCELYAKLIGAVPQHWLIVLFAWHDPQRSQVKLAQIVPDCTTHVLGCRMNKRKQHPNSTQLLEQEAVEWTLIWCE